MFTKISHNRPKNCQDVAEMLCGTRKSRHFSAFLSHFSKTIFEKRLIRQSQRLALAAWWENQPTKRKNAFAWTPQFCTAHHQVRLHALLGRFTEYKTIWFKPFIFSQSLSSASSSSQLPNSSSDIKSIPKSDLKFPAS
jgi:hypothetical protein